MTVDFSAFLNILTQYPGDLVYHLVVSISLLSLFLLAVLNLRYPNKSAAAKRILIGSSILLIIQLTFFMLDRIFSPSIFTVYSPFAMIERIIGALVVIWAVWLFADGNHKITKISISIFLSIFMVFFGAASIFLNNFDSLVISEIVRLHLLLWQVMTLFLVLLGLIILSILRPSQWPFGIAMLAILGAGYLVQILRFDPANIGMGAVRITQVLTIPLMLTLSKRISQKQKTGAKIPADLAPEVPQHERIDIKPMLVNELLIIAVKEKRAEKLEAIVRALSLSTMADFCYLVKIVPGENQLNVMIGYDLIRDIILPPVELGIYELPQIMKAWEANRFIKMSQSDIAAQDAITLTGIQNYHRIGNLLAYPLNLPGEPLTGGVIFLSPYTDRQFNSETVTLMERIRETLSQVLFESNTHEDLSKTLESLRNAHSQLLDEKQALSQSLIEKDTRIGELEKSIKQWKAKYQVDRLDCDQRIDHMKDEIARLTVEKENQTINPEQLEQLQAEIRQLTEQKDRIQAALREANLRIAELESLQGQTGPIRLSLDNQVVNLDAIGANIRLDLSAKLAQKRIDLDISNPQSRALIKTDPGLLHSVIRHLLNNAVKASAESDRILLDMNLSYETGMLILQVTDHGDGLTPGEQSKLFSLEPPEMTGIGSLQSIREAIRAIRVMNGKIWLKSKKGLFTTFRVQLPVRIID